MGELTDSFDEGFEALNRKDIDALDSWITDDVQVVDEITRSWLRGRDEVRSYFERLLGALSDVRTTAKDATEHTSSDLGLLTCWIDQDYTYEGQQQHVSAPTSVLFRRVDGRWRVVLWHSVPLPEPS